MTLIRNYGKPHKLQYRFQASSSSSKQYWKGKIKEGIGFDSLCHSFIVVCMQANIDSAFKAEIPLRVMEQEVQKNMDMRRTELGAPAARPCTFSKLNAV